MRIFIFAIIGALAFAGCESNDQEADQQNAAGHPGFFNREYIVTGWNQPWYAGDDCTLITEDDILLRVGPYTQIMVMRPSGSGWNNASWEALKTSPAAPYVAVVSWNWDDGVNAGAVRCLSIIRQ